MASAHIVDNNMSDWRKIELQFLAQETCRTSRFELTTSKRGGHMDRSSVTSAFRYTQGPWLSQGTHIHAYGFKTTVPTISWYFICYFNQDQLIKVPVYVLNF